MAFRNESKKFSKPRFDCGCVRFQRRRQKITTKKQTAFSAKTKVGPISESATPPNAGPTIPEMFICNPPSVAAERSSSGKTISGTLEAQAGAANAKPTPIKNTENRITDVLRRCSRPRTAREAAATVSHRFITTSSFLRSTISASAPAGRVKIRKGSEATVDINDIKKGDGVSVLITQVAAVSWAATHVPE